MFVKVPPVTVIRVPAQYGSFDYGAKTDGNIIYIPFNPSVTKVLENAGITKETSLTVIERSEFNNMPEYLP